MSAFTVSPDAVAGATAGLSAISGSLGDEHGRLRAHADAGAGTSAAACLGELNARWAEALPLYGLAAERLTSAIAAAAHGYAVSDAIVAGACAPGEHARPGS